MSTAGFNLSSEMIMSNGDDDSNEGYVEIILDIFEDSVAIHNIQGEAILEDPQLSSLVNKTLKNRSFSSLPCSLFPNTTLPIKQPSNSNVPQDKLQLMP